MGCAARASHLRDVAKHALAETLQCLCRKLRSAQAQGDHFAIVDLRFGAYVLAKTNLQGENPSRTGGWLPVSSRQEAGSFPYRNQLED